MPVPSGGDEVELATLPTSTRVYDVGDTIFASLSPIGADGGSVVTLQIYRPDGSSVAGAPGVINAGTFNASAFIATDDGTTNGTTLGSAGDWLLIWKIVGNGAGVYPQVFSVAPLPGTATRPPWSPFLSDVADWVPYLTVDTTTPGSQVYLGTFTAWTTPTDEQAQRHVDTAVSLIGSRIGTVPVTLYRMARAVAALRAAAGIARAFPRTRDDLNNADALARQFDVDLKILIAAADEAGTAPVTPQPVGFYPDPNWWGDLEI